jgi:hypothetical protein
LNNQWFSKIAVWLVIGLVLFTVFKQFDTHSGANASLLGYSDFLEEVPIKISKPPSSKKAKAAPKFWRSQRMTVKSKPQPLT